MALEDEFTRREKSGDALRAEKGIEDNLDPRCQKIFTHAEEQAQILQQRSRAEIQIHIGKGKWG